MIATQLVEFDMVVVDQNLDMRRRLDELQSWREEYLDKKEPLDEMLASLDLNDPEQLTLGQQILRQIKMLRFIHIKKPLTISAEVVSNIGYDALRASLVEQYIELSKAEKLAWLDNLRFVVTPDLRALIEKISGVRAYRSFGQRRNFLLGGPSGMGKSTCLDWYLSQYPPRVENERNVVPIVRIDAPVGNYPKFLLGRLVLAFGLTYTKNNNEDELMMKVNISLERCGTEVVIIDEIEHIKRPEIRRRLLDLSNHSPDVVFICASNHPVLWTEGDAEVAGRWNDHFELKPYKGEDLQALLTYLELLLPFPQESHLDLFEIDTGTEKIAGPAKLIEQWTRGILRDIMILVRDASNRAIEQNLSRLTIEVLGEAWQAIQTEAIRKQYED